MVTWISNRVSPKIHFISPQISFPGYLDYKKNNIAINYLWSQARVMKNGLFKISHSALHPIIVKTDYRLHLETKYADSSYKTVNFHYSHSKAYRLQLVIRFAKLHYPATPIRIAICFKLRKLKLDMIIIKYVINSVHFLNKYLILLFFTFVLHFSGNWLSFARSYGTRGKRSGNRNTRMYCTVAFRLPLHTIPIWPSFKAAFFCTRVYVHQETVTIKYLAQNYFI